MISGFAGAYSGTRVLVTGHTGFKGSWLCLWLRALGAEVIGLALPAATTPAHWSLLGLDGVENNEVDLRDAPAVRALVKRTRPTLVFHLAAQALVRRSYADPVETFGSNVAGLVNLFEAIRETDSVKVVVNATTDKVYREIPGQAAGYREDDPLGGHDPYSTSKACAELITDCYRKSYFGQDGIQVATARAGNVIGGGDWSADRLVPDYVRAAIAGEPLRIRNPTAIRPWQHVLEPLSGYLALGQALLAGKPDVGAWNFGPSGDATLTVLDLAQRLRKNWPGLEFEAGPGTEPQPHEAQTLRLDCHKAARDLAWHPVWDAGTTIERTAQWYRAFHHDGEIRSGADLHRYVDDAREAGLPWAA